MKTLPSAGVFLIPTAEEFRHWLQKAVWLSGLSAPMLADAAGMHRNTITTFLKAPAPGVVARGIGLDNAAALHRLVADAAAAKGIDLPPPGGGANG